MLLDFIHQTRHSLLGNPESNDLLDKYPYLAGDMFGRMRREGDFEADTFPRYCSVCRGGVGGAGGAPSFFTRVRPMAVKLRV